MKYFYIITGLVLIVSGLAGAQEEWPKMGMTLIFVGLMSGYQGIKEWRRQQEPPAIDWQKAGKLEQEQLNLLQESYAKALTDCASIEEARRKIRDVDLSKQLEKMQQISGNMLHYLERNPRKLPLARKFIDYYQDRAALLVLKYQEFEATELQTEQVQEMKERMKSALAGLDEAYEEQFERILRDQFIDLDAELKVMQQTMDADGITPKPEVPQGVSLVKNNPVSGLDGLLKQLQLPTSGKSPETAGRNGRQSTGLIPEEQKGDVLLSKIIQSALGIFLGSFGAHKFYQGKTFQGALYCLFCWTTLPGFIGFCEGIRYMCMKMDDFYLDYYLERRKDDRHGRH